MPNYKLSSDDREELKKGVSTRAHKRVEHMQAGFPLTTDQIQHGITSRDHVATMARLHAEGVMGLPKVRVLNILFHPEDFAGLERTFVAAVEVPDHVFVTEHKSDYSNGTGFNRDGKNDYFYVMRSEHLTQDERAGLIAWAHNAIKAVRLRDMANETTRIVLQQCASVAHVQAFWPMLAGMATSSRLRTRFRNPPRSLKAFAPNPLQVAALAKRMRATEVVVNQGDMLPEFKMQFGVVNAGIARFSDPMPPKEA